MTYRQDGTKRTCAICKKAIQPDQWMLDLFRAESAQPGSNRRVAWVHEDCARSAIENWIKKKEEKAANDRVGQ